MIPGKYRELAVGEHSLNNVDISVLDSSQKYEFGFLMVSPRVFCSCKPSVNVSQVDQSTLRCSGDFGYVRPTSDEFDHYGGVGMRLWVFLLLPDAKTDLRSHGPGFICLQLDDFS